MAPNAEPFILTTITAERTVAQIDQKCLCSTPKKFDRDYARKHDEDLDSCLCTACRPLNPNGTQADPFSAISSAFMTELYPTEVTAACMQILIQTVNKTVTVQTPPHASLATSLFAASITMLGKQPVNQYLRNHGGSGADKSRDRERKLDGSNQWYFDLVVESLSVMLQLVLLSLGRGLLRYLWTTDRGR